MHTLVFVENNNGTFKKNALEAIYYAKQFSTEVTALVLGNADATALANLGNYGAKTVMQIAGDLYANLDSQIYTAEILMAVNNCNAQTIVFSNTNNAKAIAPRVAIALQAGIVSGVVSLPDTSNGFAVKKSVFAGKALAQVKINSDKKVICITPNSFKIEATADVAQVTNVNGSASANTAKVQVINAQKTEGKVPLPEAELVVSGGRGLKGPENWHILEELAQSLGAELACSRPVADSHWRPHNEHVGQTGGTIKPNLYIAVGISGAIQHLAGVNSSKTIVVINKDPEAPFFKAADYGVCADAFDVLPRLTNAVKKYKESQA